MVKMSMSQDNGLDGLGSYLTQESAVFFIRLSSSSLESPTIDEYPLPIDFHEMLRTRDLSRRTQRTK